MNIKRIKCVETGQVFDSMRDAAIHIGRSFNTLSQAARGKIQTAGGYHWEYVNDEEELPKPPKPSELRSRPRMTIYEVQEEARRRSKEEGRLVQYSDIQKEETVRLIREGKL
jgi:hypothetical protein